MPTAITTSTTSTAATAYSNQRKIDRCSNGVLWAVYQRVAGANIYPFGMKFSTDNGATWSAETFPVTLSDGGTNPYAYLPNCSLFIDQDDYAHLVYKNGNDGYIYYRRGTPNAGRTAWTWSSAVEIRNDTAGNYPDIVAHREGTGWVSHVVFSVASPYAIYVKNTITSEGVITSDVSDTIIGGPYSGSRDSFPSIDFNHTGDGKTVAGGTPHLYCAWSAGATGAGHGIRFRKATYSGGSWTWGTEREIDSTRYISSSERWLNCLFDGTRIIIGGLLAGASEQIVLYERDAADTTTTTRFNNTQNGYGGSLSYDGSGNTFLFMSFFNGSYFSLGYRKWTRATTTLEAYVELDATGINSASTTSAKRGYSNNLIEFIYTDGTASPYTVTYDQIKLASGYYVPQVML